MGFCDPIRSSEVKNPFTFAQYACQQTGTPWPTKKDMDILIGKISVFFRKYPHVGYPTLTKVVDWCRANKKRFSSVYQIIDNYRYAWKAGAIPEFNDHRQEINEDIKLAYEQESDRNWRLRLAAAHNGSLDKEAARKVYEEWKAKAKVAL